MIEEGKKSWSMNTLSAVYAVSDKEYQKRVWIKGIGPECDSFDETSECILGDAWDILQEHHLFGMTEHQYRVFKKFQDEYKVFCDLPNLIYCIPERFIDTPEWTRVTELANEVIRSFNYHYIFP